MFGLWLVLVNLVTLILYRVDKQQAQRAGRRIPEVTLLALLAAGGVVGGLAGMLLRPRHKTHKLHFWVAILAASVLHAYLLTLWLVA